MMVYNLVPLFAGVADLGEIVAAATQVEDVVHDGGAKPAAGDGQGSHHCPLVCVRVIALEGDGREGYKCVY